MAKKNVQPANEEVEVIVPDVEEKTQETTKKAKASKKEKAVAEEKVEKSSKKDKNAKNSKDKAKNKKKKEKKSLKKKATEIISELKKVSKPTFKQVVKNTSVVIVVVLICTLLLFGMDKLLSLVYDLLLPNS